MECITKSLARCGALNVRCTEQEFSVGLADCYFLRISRRWKAYRPCVSPHLQLAWDKEDRIFALKRALRLIFEKKVADAAKETKANAASQRPDDRTSGIAHPSGKSFSKSLDLNSLRKIAVQTKTLDDYISHFYCVSPVPQTASGFPRSMVVLLSSDAGPSALGALKLLQAFGHYGLSDKVVYCTIMTKINTSRHALRGVVRFPFQAAGSTGKLLAFCTDADAPAMLAAGADLAGETHWIQRIQAGHIDFDRCISTPEFMPRIMPLARILGPKQLFPSPRSGTVVPNLKSAIEEIKSGAALSFRASTTGEVTVPLGTIDMCADHLALNAKALCLEIYRNRPTLEPQSSGQSQQRKKNQQQKKDIDLQTALQQRRQAFRRPVLSYYFQTSDLRDLYKPVRTERQREKQSGPDASTDVDVEELFAFGTFRCDTLPAITVKSTALNPMRGTSFNSVWLPHM